MSDLDELPQIQLHLFEAWDVSPNICARCGQLPQAHPSSEAALTAATGGRDE